MNATLSAGTLALHLREASARVDIAHARLSEQARTLSVTIDRNNGGVLTARDALTAALDAWLDAKAARNAVEQQWRQAVECERTSVSAPQPGCIKWYHNVEAVKKGIANPVPVEYGPANRLFAMLVRSKLLGGKYQAWDYNKSHDGWDVEPCLDSEQTVACFIHWNRAHTPERDSWPTALANAKMDKYRAAIASGDYLVEERCRGTKHHTLIARPDPVTLAVLANEFPAQPAG